MKYVLIKQTDDDKVLVVDTETLTVTAVAAGTALPANVQSALAAGGTLFAGVDIAVSADPRAEGSAMWLFQGN
jgi:uncharacterized protein (DUF2252 family)